MWANEPALTVEFTPGDENTAADWLSRPSPGVMEGQEEEEEEEEEGWMVDGSSIEDLVWREHCRGHYGPEKVNSATDSSCFEK